MKHIKEGEEFEMGGQIFSYALNQQGGVVLKVTPQSDLYNGKIRTKIKPSFIPPTLQEFKNYFRENGYKIDVAEMAWKGYDVAEWHKANGEKVRNWKQTCCNVWFKEPNKIKSDTNVVTDFFQK